MTNEETQTEAQADSTEVVTATEGESVPGATEQESETQKLETSEVRDLA